MRSYVRSYGRLYMLVNLFGHSYVLHFPSLFFPQQKRFKDFGGRSGLCYLMTEKGVRRTAPATAVLFMVGRSTNIVVTNCLIIYWHYAGGNWCMGEL